MELLQHFSHDHMLSLVYLKPNKDNENSDEEEEEEEKDEDEDDFVEEEHHFGQCNMCMEEIYSFHLCLYKCMDMECEYSLHKFCAQLPTTLQDHPLHPTHKLTLSREFQFYECYGYIPDFEWKCVVCNLKRKNFFNYHCVICKISIDIICATTSAQKIDHPSHPHQLERVSGQTVSHCSACGNQHQGTFYRCTTCSWFSIHLDCALLPSKMLIQCTTNKSFTHSHPLTLDYSFPYANKKARFFPLCRVCNTNFQVHLWLYKCDKCRYYVHVDCATSRRDPFMSILLPPGLGKIDKNFKDDDHPNLLHCPFPDESDNLVKHHLLHQKDFIVEENDGKMLHHSSHQHPLILFDTQTSLGVSLHNPMKKIQLLCDGCVKPITTIPFYKYSEDCGFVLHEWCARRLLSKVQHHPGHPDHTLVLLPNVPSMYFFGVFVCDICKLPSNGFSYGCRKCEYYVDINCAFLPKEITHEAHPGHLLSRINASPHLSKRFCKACRYFLIDRIAFHCAACDFYLDTECALLLPKMIRHTFDKHPLSLRYNPVENHINNYFCEICEDVLNPYGWFYHCTTCDQSMHCTCAPLILQCEQYVASVYRRNTFKYLNVKFKGTLKIKSHPHPLAFVQGIKSHGQCTKCYEELQYQMIFKCMECEFALHHYCAFPIWPTSITYTWA